MRKRWIVGVFFSVVITAPIACSSAQGDDKDGRAVIEQRVIRGPDGGWIMEDAGYCCYDYVTNSCHHAANCGVAAGNDGIVSCTGATGGPYGHTFNWDRPDPTNPSLVCFAEPQLPGSPACCCTDPNTSGPPNLSTPCAQACVDKLCPKSPDGGTVRNDAAVAMDGSWDVAYLDCAGNTKDLASCEACCDKNANDIPDWWGDAAKRDREEYRASCKAACRGRFGDSGTTKASTTSTTATSPAPSGTAIPY